MGKSVTVSFSLDNELIKDFKKYCKTKGYKMSSRIAVLIFKDMHMKKEDDKNERAKKIY